MANYSGCIVIGVDTGNRCIKTTTQVVVAGLFESEHKPTFHDGKAIRYHGRYYQISNDRCVYRRNKTQDDSYFILTLMGIMAELQVRGIKYGPDVKPPRIVLAVGLPPAHLPKQRESFRQYFNRGVVKFDYGDVPVAIEIVDVYVCPQGYAAIHSDWNNIRRHPSAYIVDIGGYTTDVVELENGSVNPRCISEDAGMIHLYHRIADEMNVQYDFVPKEQQIDRLLYDDNYELEPGMKQLALDISAQYINDFLRKLLEKGINLRLCKGVFVGGGTARLKPCILRSDFVRDPVILSDIKANAIGYEALVKKMVDAADKQQ